jgi:glycosyltransferase involved in cell wall biosynthesis
MSKRYSLALVTATEIGSANESSLTRRLLHELSYSYEICSIVETVDTNRSSTNSEIEVQSAAWFEANAHKFDRIVYDVAASPAHYFMWSLFDKFPGTVLLHDLYLSEALAYRYRLSLCSMDSIQNKVYQEQGYQALANFVKASYDFDYLRKFPMALEILQSSLLIIVSSAEMRGAILENFSKNFTKKIAIIDSNCQEAIENTYVGSRGERIRAIQRMRAQPVDELALRVLSQQLDEQFPVDKFQHRLFLDVSSVARSNLKTGIQRVTHNLLLALIGQSLEGYRVEPVYTETGAQGYFFARKFTQALLELDDVLDDRPVQLLAGDIFFGLDLCCSDIVEHSATLETAHAQGVKILFLVHDLLPVAQPLWFPFGVKSGFEDWLQVISRFDGAICVSFETANHLKGWRSQNFGQVDNRFDIHVCHNGVDRMTELSAEQRSNAAIANFSSLKKRPTFLMVGTIEPRKGYSQVLDAFDRLWIEGGDYNLVLVGKKGWNVESLVSRVLQHPEYMSRLHWYQGLGDDGLVFLYQQSSCLIAASEGEGFGLPLIEAAQFNLPIIARDIPVFREVAEGAAYFFKASNGAELVRVIENWLELFSEAKAPPSRHLSYLSWDQCAKNYSSVLQSYFQ